MKLAIRADREAGLIRAYFSTLDDREGFEVATLRMSLAEADRANFEAWHQCLAEMLRRELEAQGVPVVGMQVIRLEDKN